MNLSRFGYGLQPYGWGGYGGSIIPVVSTPSGGVGPLIHWRRRGWR